MLTHNNNNNNIQHVHAHAHVHVHVHVHGHVDMDMDMSQLNHVHENGGAENLFDDLTLWVGQKKKGDVYKTLKKRNMVTLKTTKELFIGP